MGNILAKKLGLQTRYAIASGTIDNTGGTSSAQMFFLGMGTSPDYTTNMTVVTAGSDEKVTLRSQYVKMWFTNSTNSPVYIWYWWIRPRKLNSQNLFTTLQDGHPGWNVNYVDPTLGTAFRRFWKIGKRGCRKLDSAGTTQFKAKRFWKGGLQISGDVEGTYNWIPKTTSIILLKVGTPPMETTGAGNTTALGLVKLNWIESSGCTFYNIEDNDPSVSGSTTLNQASSTTTFTDVVSQVDAVVP